MSKPLWIILFILSGLLALWKSVGAGIELFGYMRLSTEVPAQVTEWEIVPKGSKYGLRGHFSYVIRNEQYVAESVLPQPYFLNRGAALKELEALEGMQWSAWVDPRRPDIAELQKIFPFKQVAYAAILLGIFLYFTLLKIWVHLSTRVWSRDR